MSERDHILLRVEGMTCEGCARHVTEALKAVPGVEAAQVGSWRAGLATVVTKAMVTDHDLLSALQKSGYHGVIMEHRGLESTRAITSSSEPGLRSDDDRRRVGGLCRSDKSC